MNKKFLLLLLLCLFSLRISAETYTPDEIVTFKKTPQRDLTLHIFYPNDQKKGKNRPVVISFFGGGWATGNPNQFYEQSEYYASLGMVAISAEYRISKTDKTTPFECVMDGKSAVRWVREHYKELGINPNKIVTSGGSAGGHVAACTALIEGYEDDEDLSISSVPNAMILFNPVLNTTKAGYGANKLVGRETEISAYHHIRPNLPPTIVMHGTHDTTVPYQNSVDFTKEMVENGNDCTLISAFGENHGFFNGTFFRESCGHRNIDRCMYESTLFLSRLGFISKKIKPTKEPLRIACLGNSITFGATVTDRANNSYPAVLQGLVGDDYEVKNFGLSGSTLLKKGNKPYTESDQYKQLYEYAPEVIILKLGTNDSKAMNWKYGDEFMNDYIKLIEALKANPVRRPEIIVCAPTPAFLGNETEKINDSIIVNQIIPIIKQVAKKKNLLFIDTYSHFEGKGEFFPDKIHPNNEGAKELANYIYKVSAQK
ncbi:MAG: GDSL-type esterase/lipase family protein [Rikenellaceae bacterium]